MSDAERRRQLAKLMLLILDNAIEERNALRMRASKSGHRNGVGRRLKGKRRHGKVHSLLTRNWRPNPLD